MISHSIHPFVLPLFLSAFVAGSISLCAYRRNTPGSKLFALMTLVITHYAMTYSVELMSSTLDAMLFWIKLEYIGIVSAPVLLLLFTLVYTGRGQWLTPRQIALSFALPIIILLLVWTNRWHALFYSTTSVIEVHGFPQLAATPGIAYWINVLYAYALLLISIILLIRYYAATSTLYRRQIGFLLVGILIPWIGDIIYIFFPPRQRQR